MGKYLCKHTFSILMEKHKKTELLDHKVDITFSETSRHFTKVVLTLTEIQSHLWKSPNFLSSITFGFGFLHNLSYSSRNVRPHFDSNPHISDNK